MWVHLLKTDRGFQDGDGRALNQAQSPSVGGPQSDGSGPLPSELALLTLWVWLSVDSCIHLTTFPLYLEML